MTTAGLSLGIISPSLAPVSAKDSYREAPPCLSIPKGYHKDCVILNIAMYRLNNIKKN